MGKKYLPMGILFLISAVMLVISHKASDTPDRKLDIRVFFGYKDARPARFVADRYEAALFLQKLSASCLEKERKDCGFTLVSESFLSATNSPATSSAAITSIDSQTPVLQKMIRGQDGKLVQVSVRVFTSSAEADDHANRQNPFQKWKSEHTQKQFARALALADVVFYNGHSRSGGGPDFSVPELTKAQHVNYRTYQKRKLGLQLLQTVLKQNPHAPLKMVGLYSCQSDQLFRKKIEAAKPGLKVIGSRQLLYFSDALNDSLDQISQIIKTI